MPTNVVNSGKNGAWLLVFLAGCCLGGVIGASKGAAVARNRDHRNYVSWQEYEQVCNELNQTTNLYYGEMHRNALLLGARQFATQGMNKLKPKSVR